MRQLQLPMVLAGFGLLAGLALWAGLSSVMHAFAALGIMGFSLVVLIHVPLVGLLGSAWWSTGRAGRAVGVLPFVKARLVRDSVAELLPFSQIGGFAAGIRLLSLAGIPMEAGAFSLFADLLMEFLGKVFYAMAGLALLVWLRPGTPPPPYLLVTIGLLVGASLITLLIRDRLLSFASRFFNRRISDRAAHGLHSSFAPRFVAPSLILHVVCWALGGLEALVTLRLMGIHVTIPGALAIDSLVTCLRTFGFWMPAALGVQEAAYVLVCALFGLSPHMAIALSLIRRARETLIGCLGLAVWQGMEVKFARRTASTLNLEAALEP